MQAFNFCYVILDNADTILGMFGLQRYASSIQKMRACISEDFSTTAVFRTLYLIQRARKKGISKLIIENLSILSLGMPVFLQVSEYNVLNNHSLQQLKIPRAKECVNLLPNAKTYVYSIPPNYTAFQNAASIEESEVRNRTLIMHQRERAMTTMDSQLLLEKNEEYNRNRLFKQYAEETSTMTSSFDSLPMPV